MPGNARLAHTAADTIRRTRVSSVTVTAYQAGLDVFTTELASLEQSGAYFLPMLMRGKGVNPWRNSRIAALLRLGMRSTPRTMFVPISAACCSSTS